MADPSPLVRQGTYERDGERCVRCGDTALTYQHRQAGGGKTPPTFVQGVAACMICNGRFEHDLQTKALRYGWKVRRWVRDQSLVPVYYVWLHSWARLHHDGGIELIEHDEAEEMMLRVYGEEHKTRRAELS